MRLIILRILFGRPPGNHFGIQIYTRPTYKEKMEERWNPRRGCDLHYYYY
jgi:hypothetical protein